MQTDIFEQENEPAIKMIFGKKKQKTKQNRKHTADQEIIFCSLFFAKLLRKVKVSWGVSLALMTLILICFYTLTKQTVDTKHLDLYKTSIKYYVVEIIWKFAFTYQWRTEAATTRRSSSSFRVKLSCLQNDESKII